MNERKILNTPHQAECAGPCPGMEIDPMSRLGLEKSKSPARKPTAVNIGDPARLTGELKALGGSQSDDWNNRVANDAVAALWLNNSDENARDRQRVAAIHGLIGIGPKDEIEGMVAAQMIAAHSAAMECHRRAMLGEQTLEGRRENLSQANKLSRSFAVLLDALNRHRGKGQQTVRVEHVHIYQGGQAIVGAVSQGGGDRAKLEGQPHAIADAPEPALRCPDPVGPFLPIAGNAEWPLPDAWRKVHGSAEGQ